MEQPLGGPVAVKGAQSGDVLEVEILDLHPGAGAGRGSSPVSGYLTETHGLTPEDAYVLCSVAVDLKISEVVDKPNWIVTAYAPLSMFG